MNNKPFDNYLPILSTIEDEKVVVETGKEKRRKLRKLNRFLKVKPKISLK